MILNTRLALRLFDMPVFFARDLSKLSNFISVWYGHSAELRAPSNIILSNPHKSIPTLTLFTQLPVKVLYPRDYLPTPNAEQSRLINQYVTALESALQTKREEISLAKL